MASNRGRTRLKSRSSPDPMSDFDALPAPLRRWVAEAKRPWSARTVRKSYAKAFAKTGDESAALSELTCLQNKLIAKDATFVWGPDHPEVRR